MQVPGKRASSLFVALSVTLLLGALLVAFPHHSLAASKRKTWGKLDKLVKRWMKRGLLRKAKIGIAVATTDGTPLYRYNAKRTYFPASNTKLITMAVALKTLGAGYRYITKIYGDRRINRRGVLRGNLYIKGSGDPYLRSEELWRISRDLYNMGLRRITGRVVFDRSVFDAKRFGTGWRHHKHQWYRPYLAPIGGLSLNFNAMGVVIRPGSKVGRKARIAIDPPSRYIRRIINRTKTTRSGRFRMKLKVLSYKGFRDTVVVKGRVPVYAKAKTYWRRINHPGWYTAYVFADSLRKQKIRVSPWPKRKRIPSRAVQIYQHYSPTLLSILQYTGKFSSNFATEQLLKTVAVKKRGKPGTWKKGLAVIREFLKSIGVPEKQYKMVNGSGLGRINQFAPVLFVKLLQHMYSSFRWRVEYIVSQPTAGVDGTLRRRMRNSPAARTVRAKTGTLDGISTLSGYVQSPNKRMLVFSFCMNSEYAHKVSMGKRTRRYMQRQTRQFRRFQDALGKFLAKNNVPNRLLSRKDRK